MEGIIGSVVVCSSAGCCGISELLIESLVLLEGFVTLLVELLPNILLSGSRTREECSSEEDIDALKLLR